jgi:hypothetical protein
MYIYDGRERTIISSNGFFGRGLLTYYHTTITSRHTLRETVWIEDANGEANLVFVNEMKIIANVSFNTRY